MSTSDSTLRVAAVQQAPAFLDRARSAERAGALVREAGSQGAQLIAFGEGVIPGHPIWLHLLPVTAPRSIELATALTLNAVTIPGPETDALSQAAREAGAMVIIGVVERSSPGSSVLFMAQLVYGADGELIGVRRKLVPAVGERVLLAPGAGDAIRTFDSQWGPLSALLGGENANPLLTWTMRELGARIHVAAWPPHFNKAGVMGEVMTITGRAIAYQNSAYVIAVRTASSPEAREAIAASAEERKFLTAIAAEPGSVVFAPRGAVAAGPLEEEEGILYADLDLNQGTWASLVNRHYDRPDLFRVHVDRRGRDDPLSFSSTAAIGVQSSTGETAPARARWLIEARFGDSLPPDDIDRLVPYVTGSLDAAARLEDLALSDVDPRRIVFAQDPRIST